MLQKATKMKGENVEFQSGGFLVKKKILLECEKRPS